MKQKIVYVMFAALLCTLLFACGVGKKQYDVAMQLSQSGKNLEAIAYLEQAIAKEPSNKKYRQALTDLKKQLIEEYIAEGEKALSVEGGQSISAINIAKTKLAMAQDVDANSKAVKQFADKLKSAEDALVAEVGNLYATAKDAINVGDWLQAQFSLQQVQSRFPGFEDSMQLLSQATNDGSLDYFNQGKAAFTQENFPQAAALLEKALTLNPGNTEAREMLSQARESDSLDYFVQKANGMLTQQKWDEAVKSYEKALNYEPTNQDLLDLIDRVKGKAGYFYIRTSQKQLAEGWLYKGFENYVLALSYSADPNDYELNNLKQKLSDAANVIAQRFAEEGNFGSAWFWYQQIKQINPEYPEIFYLTQNMEDKIRGRVKKSIAVFDFNSPSDNHDAGIIVANNLITYLFKNASGDVKILERENLKSILEEMKLGQIGVVSASSAKEMGRVYGIDVAIMGSVLLYKVDSSSSTGTKTVRYQIGEKIEDNIEYLNWIAKKRNPTSEQLAKAPPAKIKVPEFAEKDYEVSQHKKVGFVQLSFRIVDVATGENIQVKTIERKQIAEDEASAGLAEAKVKFDPLEIPMDTELLQQMTDEVVAELGRETLRPLQNLEQTYFKEGENYLRRRNVVKAAESFVDAIFDEKLKRIQNSPLTANADQRLKEIFDNFVLLP